MTPPGPPDDERHFNGLNTRLVVQYLTARHPAGTVEAVLRRAGETRSAAMLADDSTWSSYGQFRRLLEATAEEVGWDELPRIALGTAVMEGEAAPSAAPLQELGSPEALLQAGVDSGASMGMSAVSIVVGGESTGPGGYRIRIQLVEGFEPFRALCGYTAGLFAVVPTVFGFPPGEVVEERCACDGAPYCQYSMHWQSTGGVEDRVHTLEARVGVLQGQLDSLESTVADLVSTDDVGATLARIVDAAARTLRAPTYALVLDEAAPAPAVRVVGGDEATTVEAVRGADPEWDKGVLVAPVCSGEVTYGRLAILETGRTFRPHERRVLTSYARLAAAALESAAAVADARRQAGTASALLRLSTALGQVMSSGEMAAVLARAVPAVIDCDRAVVVLSDPARGVARIAGTYGYPDEVVESFMRAEFPMEAARSEDGIDVTSLGAVSDEDAGSGLMRVSGSVAVAVVDMVVDGTAVGQVVAAVTERPERLARTADLEERLRGIAALGSAAVHNGRLVDSIRHQATHDALTGLPNRTLILDRLDQLLKRRQRVDRPVSVLFIDLDGFKDVNDTLGHEAGDRLLRATADRLRAAMREGDTVGRLGGDEFVVVVHGDEGAPTAEAVAERVLDVLAEPFALDERRSLGVTASIGIAAASAGDGGDLLREADVALYEAKAAGKGRAVRFRAAMGRQAHQRLTLEVELQRAVAERQFFLLYQPIVDLPTGRISGVEALIRWQHPTRGVVSPAEFIPLLEESGLIVPVGAWVLREACRQAKEWERDGAALTLSVNVSPRQLQRPELIDHVRRALDGAGLEPGRLVVEITEGGIMRDLDGAGQQIARLRAMGVRVAVDDFGTGNWSLTAIRDMQIDVVKIDRSFVAALACSPQSRSLVRLFVQLGRELNLATVAEGVEEAAQLAELLDESCQHAQGFLFAQPVEPAELRRLLADHHALRP